MSNTVLKELKDGILLLTLNRPEKKNAFNAEQWKALAAELDAARENDDVTVAVITGAGNDFSAGQDLTDTAVPGALLILLRHIILNICEGCDMQPSWNKRTYFSG